MAWGEWEEASMAEKAFAVVGLFDSADALLAAIPRVRGRAAGRLEAYTPYPVHGLDAALGLRRSPLGGMVLVMGIIGALAAIGFQVWASAADYPVVTGGKATASWQAFVPIVFEIMVLFATFTAGLGMLILLNRLPGFGHPLLRSKAIAGITRDRYALAIEREARDVDLDVDAARAALAAAGADPVEVVPVPAPPPLATAKGLGRTGMAIAASCLVAGLGTYWAVKLFPVLPPMVHMLDQPRLDAQRPSALFPDGAGMRLPVEGTVARGHLPPVVGTPEEAARIPNPLPRTAPVLARGKKAYNQYCSVCHGATGNGVPTLTAAYGGKPANLLAEPVSGYSDGTIHAAIVAGKNSMPSYAAELDEDARWAAVHYVRVLQRAQAAKDSDLPEGTR